MSDYRSDPFIAQTAKAVRDLYGDRLKGILLFGSRARGDATAESDYDYLVLLEEPFDYTEERYRLSTLAFELTKDNGQSIYFKPEPPSALDKRTIFMWNVRKDAVPV